MLRKARNILFDVRVLLCNMRNRSKQTKGPHKCKFKTSPTTGHRSARKRIAPAALAPAAKPGRSNRYGYVPTNRVIEALNDLGYGVVAAKQGRGRLPDSAPYGKHMVVLQRTSDPVDAGYLNVGKLVGRGDSVSRLALVNSHDGRSAYSMRLGFYRFVCSNTAIQDGATMFARKIRHTDLTLDAIIQAARDLAGKHGEYERMLEQMTKRELSRTEALDFAQFARDLRWGDKPGPAASQLLEARRVEDDGRHLWEVFNTVQENVIRGGGEYSAENKHGQRVLRRARPINAVREDLRLNGALLERARDLVAA